MYKIDDKTKETNFVKILIPAVVVSITVFAIIKYKENISEPMMRGNYFD